MTEAYHVVTERPMFVGQHIVCDGGHRNGVYRRVQDKIGDVKAIMNAPGEYDFEKLEHHTAVAIREMAMEQVRLSEFPECPSRMACLYVSRTLEEAEKWAGLFAEWGRTTYHIVRLRTKGHVFVGNAMLCFAPSPEPAENMRRARAYWNNEPDGREPIVEMLMDGDIEVMEIVKEIGANISNE